MNCYECGDDIYEEEPAYDFDFGKIICDSCVTYAKCHPRIKCDDCGVIFYQDDIIFIAGKAFCEKCLDKRAFKVMGE
jgi:formylmethanofuran dehydrogenase subunit E